MLSGPPPESTCDEADSPLDNPARQQFARTELMRARCLQSIGAFRRRGFLRELDCFGRVDLHSEGQFVGRNAGLHFTVEFVRLEFVHGLQKIQHGALTLGRDALRTIGVQGGIRSPTQ